MELKKSILSILCKNDFKENPLVCFRNIELLTTLSQTNLACCIISKSIIIQSRKKPRGNNREKEILHPLLASFVILISTLLP